MKNKYIFLAILVFLVPYIIIWTFNHINVWISFLEVITTIFIINHFINKQNKNNEKNN